jgi:hypothetical protein
MEEVIERTRIRDAGVVRGLRYAIWLMANGEAIIDKQRRAEADERMPARVREEAGEHRVWMEELIDRTNGLALDPGDIPREIVEQDIDYVVRELLGDPVEAS